MSLFQTLRGTAAAPEPAGELTAEAVDALLAPNQVLDRAPIDLSARTVCVWGPAAAGKSTVALNLATELALLDKRVLLVDADAEAPVLAVMLGITENPPGLTAALRLVQSDRLDEAQWSRVTERIEFERTGFDFLAGLSSPRRWPELRAEAIEKLLSWLAPRYDFVIFDVAANLDPNLIDSERLQPRSEATNYLVSHAQLTLAICAADVISVNRFLWAVRELKPNTFTTIANRLRSQALGSSPNRQLADTLHHFAKLSPHTFLPEDSACDASLLAAKPLALQAKNSKLREALRLLAIDLETL
jgi:MinD-like ATPase involved in chromosome partitioning or flagellar assembly